MGYEHTGLQARLLQIQAESDRLKERLEAWMKDARKAYESPDPPDSNMVADVQVAADCHRACCTLLEKALSR